MTIREHFQLMLKRTTYVAVATGLAVAVAFLWLYHGPNKQEGMLWLLIYAAFVPVLLIVSRVVYRCPRCHADFYKLRVKQLGRWKRDMPLYWDLWDACPQCHVSFDEHWD